MLLRSDVVVSEKRSRPEEERLAFNTKADFAKNFQKNDWLRCYQLAEIARNKHCNESNYIQRLGTIRQDLHEEKLKMKKLMEITKAAQWKLSTQTMHK